MVEHDVLITGGAGFIGSNLTNRMLEDGHSVLVFDNLSRPGCRSNIEWLRKTHGADSFELMVADLSDFEALQRATEGTNRIYHLAGQVAVTSSIENPRADFESNALGTLNALEAARTVGDHPIFIYASTNKVYGSMKESTYAEDETRYRSFEFADGIPETFPLNFHSPYGCSKGAGDQYTRDYARVYGLRTVVMRQSCIYGSRQFGIEDQGWAAWFTIAALKGLPTTIYGGGKQVRDMLYIDDLLDAYEAAVERSAVSIGQIYNIGGGPKNTLSIWVEFGPLLEELIGHSLQVTYEEPRLGDQLSYVSDIHKAERDLDWRPKVDVHKGIGLLFHWLKDNQYLFDHLQAKGQPQPTS